MHPLEPPPITGGVKLLSTEVFPSPESPRASMMMLLLRTCVLATLASLASAQAAGMIGGKPPATVVTDQCSIGAVFRKLAQIKGNKDCMAECAGGKCPPNWYPGKNDKCSAKCGKVFEPFWDQCGQMLTAAKMGGMDGMGKFYDRCLQTLYPAGSCGTFCNGHTYSCFLREVNNACCDEKGGNCVKGSPVPQTCPVGCALVFPEFLETCRDHIKTVFKKSAKDFETFEKKCLHQDALGLVEYALDMKRRGCYLNLDGGKRRLQSSPKFMSGYVGSSTKTCTWDQVDDFAADVDKICCGASGRLCPGGRAPNTCSLGCAVSTCTAVGGHARSPKCSLRGPSTNPHGVTASAADIYAPVSD
jgi:hypothetical protein